MPTLKEAIAQALARKGWDYKTLATETGLERSTVLRYLRGDRDMTGKRLDKVLSALGLELPIPVNASRRKHRVRGAEPTVEVPRRTFDISQVALTNCDCTKLPVEQGSAKLILTDPPWSKSPRLWRKFGESAHNWLAPDGLVVSLMANAMLPQFVEAVQSSGLRYQWIMPMLFPTNTNEKNGIFSCWRPFVVFSKKHFRFNGVPDLVEAQGPEKLYHEWQQAVFPFRRLIERLTMPDDLVVDCFVGTGTTAIACCQADGGPRRCIAGDKDQQMIQIAKKRLESL